MGRPFLLALAPALASFLAGCGPPPVDPSPSIGAEVRLAGDSSFGQARGFLYDGEFRDHPAVQEFARAATGARGDASRRIAEKVGLDGRTAPEVVLEGASARSWTDPVLRGELRILEGRSRPVVSILVPALATGRATPDEVLVEALTVGQVLARRGEDFFLLPPWFRTGLSLYASGRGDAVLESRLAEILPSNQSPSVLVRGLDVESPGGWELAGYLAFATIEETWGPASLKDFVRVVVEDGVEVANAFAVGLGISAEAFRSTFLAYAAERLERVGAPAQAPFRAAMEHYQAGRIPEAAAAFRAIAEGPPSYATGSAWYRAGLCAMRRQAWEEALPAFDRVRSEHAGTCPSVDLAAATRAECLVRLSRALEAIPSLEDCLRDYPGSIAEPRVRFLLGEAQLAAGRPEDARAAFLAHRGAFPKDDGRFAVALALGRIAFEAGEYGLARRELEAAERSSDRALASQAIEVLGRIHDLESGEPPPEVVARVRGWTADLLGSDEAASSAARQKLTRAGPLALPYLGEALAEADVPGRVRLVETLAALRDGGAARWLLASLRTDPLPVQLACLAGLLDLGVEPESVRTLVEAVGRDMDEASRGALFAELDRLFFHSTPDLRRRVPHLVDRLRSPDGDVRVGVLLDLNRLQSSDAVPVLAHLLEDPDPAIRHKALLAANLWGDARLRPGLVAVLSCNDPADRALAVHLVVRFRIEGAFALVEKALVDPHTGVRQAAVTSIAELDDPVTPAALLSATRDADPRVASSAEDALLAIPARRVVPELLAELRRPDLPPSRQTALFRMFERASGTPAGFDPEATEDARRGAVQKVEAWWLAQEGSER